MRVIQANPVVPGDAQGKALVSNIPLSFWGGVDPHTGKVIDVHHDLSGQILTGRALLIPAGRGSCSGSGIMLEMIRQNTCPALLVSIEAEPIISLGSVMGFELYKRGVPIFIVTKEEFYSIPQESIIEACSDGTIQIG